MNRWIPAVVVLLAALAGCATPPPSQPQPQPTPSAVGDPTSYPTPRDFDQKLHDELIGMAERDQAGISGETVADTDVERTARLGQIFDAVGWPGFDMVGQDGGDAAWLIAQHSDLNPQFQQRALALLQVAADAGQASGGNVAYLTDRVAVARDEPQTFGTQVACDETGTPQLRTPIADEATVDQRRSDAGLPPLDEYLAEMAGICAQG